MAEIIPFARGALGNAEVTVEPDGTLWRVGVRSPCGAYDKPWQVRRFVELARAMERAEQIGAAHHLPVRIIERPSPDGGGPEAA